MTMTFTDGHLSSGRGGPGSEGSLELHEVLFTPPTTSALIRAVLREHGDRFPSDSAEGFVHSIGAIASPGQLRTVGLSAGRPIPQPRRFVAGWPILLLRVATSRWSFRIALMTSDRRTLLSSGGGGGGGGSPTT